MEQEKLGQNVSRRRISRIMNENGLVSNYTVAQYKVHTNNCNESSIPNIVDRKFETLEQLQLELAEYIFWYNNLRVHGVLGYKTPIEYRELSTMTLGKTS